MPQQAKAYGGGDVQLSPKAQRLLRHLDWQLRRHALRQRLGATCVVVRTAPRQRGAGRPGVRRVARATASGDPPDGPGEHHLDGRRP